MEADKARHEPRGGGVWWRNSGGAMKGVCSHATVMGWDGGLIGFRKKQIKKQCI